jgi:hypothetical protein
MFYVIRYDTWTVEEADVHDIRDPKFSTELDAEEVIEKKLTNILAGIKTHQKEYSGFLVRPKGYYNALTDCQNRIQKLKQQSI